MKIADFTHTCLSHIPIISYPSRPSSHSSPPLLHPSKHPILQWGLAECAERSAAPLVRRAGRAQRRNLPVLLRLFKLLSSSSSLNAFNFLLQSLSSIFCIDFGCLGRLFLPSIILPIGLRIPPGPSP